MTNILLVDDEPLLCEELKESLELEGYDVETEHSVPKGLAVVEQSAIDVVITDLKMPQVGGLEFIKALRETSFDGAIIVVSGHGAESSREEAMSLGACACLAKPVDVDEVMDVIARQSA